MLVRPATIALMCLSDGPASRLVHGCAATRVVVVPGGTPKLRLIDRTKIFT
jgi:hypothetical protein